MISDIAHQLKTPLTNMKMYSEFLQDENLTKEEREEFNKIILLSLDKLCFGGKHDKNVSLRKFSN